MLNRAKSLNRSKSGGSWGWEKVGNIGAISMRGVYIVLVVFFIVLVVFFVVFEVFFIVLRAWKSSMESKLRSPRASSMSPATKQLQLGLPYHMNMNLNDKITNIDGYFLL